MDRDDKSPWEYKPDGMAGPNDSSLDDAPNGIEPKQPHHRSVAWEAVQFIEHRHNTGWYMMLFLATVGLAGGVYLAFKDIIAAVIITILGVIVAIFASQKPGLAKYEISDTGLSVNGKIYRYGDFKSFAILREGQLSSINLLPLKRFMPPVAAYFDPKEEKKIVDAVGSHLPYEERHLDGMDRLSRRLRL